MPGGADKTVGVRYYLRENKSLWLAAGNRERSCFCTMSGADNLVTGSCESFRKYSRTVGVFIVSKSALVVYAEQYW
jgi:hypothetical protein